MRKTDDAEQQRLRAEKHEADATLRQHLVTNSRWVKKVVNGKIVLDGPEVCFVKRGKNVFGPFHPNVIRHLAEAASVLPDDLFAVSGFHSWLEFRSINLDQLDMGISQKVDAEWKRQPKRQTLEERRAEVRQ